MHMTPYLGRTYDPPRDGLLGTHVVKMLLSTCNMLHRGYHVTVDSFFTSIDLARQLLQRGTYVTGKPSFCAMLSNLIHELTQ